MPFTTYGVAPTRDGAVLGFSANTAVADGASVVSPLRGQHLRPGQRPCAHRRRAHELVARFFECQHLVEEQIARSKEHGRHGPRAECSGGVCCSRHDELSCPAELIGSSRTTQGRGASRDEGGRMRKRLCRRTSTRPAVIGYHCCRCEAAARACGSTLRGVVAQNLSQMSRTTGAEARARRWRPHVRSALVFDRAVKRTRMSGYFLLVQIADGPRQRSARDVTSCNRTSA